MKKKANKIRIRVIGADIPYMLTQVIKQEIILSDIKPEDRFTITGYILGKDWKKLQTWLHSHGYSVQLVSEGLVKRAIQEMNNRKLLLVGVLFMAILTLFLSQYVLFISVDGNQNLSSQIILEAAGNSGLKLGIKKKDIHNDQVKNEMLHKLQNLDWIGIDVQGCSAIIRVQEKELPLILNGQDPSFGNIVSSHDGIVLSATAQKGSLMVTAGQTVQEGQLLISGYTDCGAVLQVTRPEGEIMAQTKRRLSVCTPAATVERGDKIKEECHYGLRIGKKLIKLYKDSGIYHGSCVKMYTEEYWELPGSFTLPIAFTKESISYFETTTRQVSPEELYENLLCSAEAYIRSRIIAGELLDVQTDCIITDTHGMLSCLFTCRESIGIYTNEELVQ